MSGTNKFIYYSKELSSDKPPIKRKIKRLAIVEYGDAFML